MSESWEHSLNAWFNQLWKLLPWDSFLWDFYPLQPNIPSWSAFRLRIKHLAGHSNPFTMRLQSFFQYHLSLLNSYTIHCLGRLHFSPVFHPLVFVFVYLVNSLFSDQLKYHLFQYYFPKLPKEKLLSSFDIFVSILVGECSVYDFNSFTFVEVCFVLQIYLGICLVNTWKKLYILLLLGGVFYKCSLDPVGLWCF